MWKLFLALLFLIAQAQEGFCVTQWNKGAPAATDLKSIWPATSQANNAILDSLLSNFQRGFYLTYTNASTITALPGEIVVSNAGGTIRLFLVKTTSTAITSANIDTGAVTANTTYYIYAGTSTNTDSAPTFYFSLSSTTPTGVTYYAQVGSFTTDSASQFTGITNYNVFTGYVVGPPVTKTANVVYQALTDGFFIASGTCSNTQNFSILTDSSSSPVTNLGSCVTSSGTTNFAVVFGTPIRKGDYYEVTGSGAGSGRWIQTGI